MGTTFLVYGKLSLVGFVFVFVLAHEQPISIGTPLCVVIIMNFIALQDFHIKIASLHQEVWKQELCVGVGMDKHLSKVMHIGHFT